ncbi:transcription initiation factor TFIID subunit 8 [Cornus florida]|uniref:transcription initiation factor TFIID subunit 8 n=1 Tax=Cornus florida TaxID=4283 RepID=UPI0028A09835|nr:transcription initiation factor TFIID subunit 8 [Cornus florida]
MKSKTLEIQDHESSPSEFSMAITRIAVSQICQSVGFKASQRSALHTLTDVAARYLQALGKSAASFAISSGRTQSNLFDVVCALEELYSVQGFRGASTVNGTLLTSSTLADIIKFVKYTDEIPFAKPVRWRYSFKPQNSINCKRWDCVNSHIPRWLPAVPDMSEYEIGGKGNWREERGWFGSFGNVNGCLVGEKMEAERESYKRRKKKKKKMELPAKRVRVRFRMGVGVSGNVVRRGEGFGVDLRNGVCRGGKRISCENRSDEDDKRLVKKPR